MAVAEGDAGTAWGLCLGAHHAQGVGSWFPEQGQLELFETTGNFKCPHRAAPMGTSTPVDGGYVVKGQWDYCSGVGHATHFMCNTIVPGRESEGLLTICTPIENVTVIDDWGDGATIGMNSSGSNSVRVVNVFVPEHCTCSGDWTHNTEKAAPGMYLHEDWMFCGRIYAMYHAGMVIPVIGAAKGAMHEYEHTLRTKKTYFPPQVPRYTVEEYQRHYGQARALIDCAEAIIFQCGKRYNELAERWYRTGEPFTREDDAAMYSMIQVASRMAVEATNELFGAASSSAAKRVPRCSATTVTRRSTSGTSPPGTTSSPPRWRACTSGCLTTCSERDCAQNYRRAEGAPEGEHGTTRYTAVPRRPRRVPAAAGRAARGAAAFAAGEVDAAGLTAAEDQAITDAIRLQEDAGLASATDGEFRREQWHSDFLYAIDGIDKGAPGAPLPVYRKDGTITWTPNVTAVTGKVHLEQPIFGDHFGFLARTVTTATPKLTVPSPSMAHFRADLSKSPYTDYAQFRADVAAAYAAEVAALYELGCRYLQFDDTIFAFLNDPAWRANASAAGLDPEHQHEINVAVINDALAAKPADMAVTVHMCRGNYQSAWFGP